MVSSLEERKSFDIEGTVLPAGIDCGLAGTKLASPILNLTKVTVLLLFLEKLPEDKLRSCKVCYKHGSLAGWAHLSLLHNTTPVMPGIAGQLPEPFQKADWSEL